MAEKKGEGMMFRIRKLIHFEMAHRLASSWSKPCQRLHGHSYVAEIILDGSTLNEDGMVLDFGALKEILQSILAVVDHRTLLKKNDPLIKAFGQDEVVEVPYNPTAENMAKDFCQNIMSRVYELDNISAVTVRLHETATGWAEYSITKQEFEKLIEEAKK